MSGPACCATLCGVSTRPRSTPPSTPPAPPDRAPLPEDPWSLPAPGPEWTAELDRGLAALGLDPSPGVRRALDAHSRLLLAWTAAINLTAVRDPAGVARLHLVDSLSAVAAVRADAPAGPAILDIGSGGGFPGLPLGLAVGAARLALIDSVGKKVRFQAVAAAACAAALAAAGETPPAIEAHVARAEDLARLRSFRGAFDVVTARAVTTLTELIELGMPLLRIGGILVAWKRDDGSGALDSETSAAARIARATGAGRIRVLHDPEPAIPGHRLVVVRKERDTADRFPRTPTERRRAPDG
jgi:16S rRNA (guanine527-N7)-methyltransferase